MSTQQPPPTILQIYRERLKAGTESAYDGVERQIAALCRTMSCPHPYLGLQTVTGPTEVWFLNGYRSPDERQEVVAAYAQKPELIERMTRLAAQKRPFTESPREQIATRAGTASGSGWWLGLGRFLVVLTAPVAPQPPGGTRFDLPDGTSVTIWSAPTQEDAIRRAAELGSEARVLAVRPEWSHPDPSWIDHDPAFWRANSSPRTP